jgi:hypothetical protein
MAHSRSRTFVELQGQMKDARHVTDRIRCGRALSVRAGAMDDILPTTI